MTKINGRNSSEYPEYGVYVGMKARCLNPNVEAYKSYGGRGIRICDRWLESFSNFLEDMGERPSPNHSIDRIQNDGNYDPSNCRWATRAQQMDNRRDAKESSNAWTDTDDRSLRSLYDRYVPVEEIAVQIARTLGATRKRICDLGLRRDARIFIRLRNYPEFRDVFFNEGVGALEDAIRVRRENESNAANQQREEEQASAQRLVQSVMCLKIHRNQKMGLLRRHGFTLDYIGKLFGLTRQRIEQIESKGFTGTKGVRGPSGYRRRVVSTPTTITRKIDPIKAIELRNEGYRLREIAEHFGASVSAIHAAIERHSVGAA